MKEVIVFISALGDVKVEASGFKGRKCMDATEQLEIVLGGSETKKKPKPEFYQPDTKTVEKLTF